MLRKKEGKNGFAKRIDPATLAVEILAPKVSQKGASREWGDRLGVPRGTPLNTSAGQKYEEFQDVVALWSIYLDSKAFGLGFCTLEAQGGRSRQEKCQNIGGFRTSIFHGFREVQW